MGARKRSSRGVKPIAQQTRRGTDDAGAGNENREQGRTFGEKVEALSQMSALVVAAQHEERLRVVDLQRQHIQANLTGEIASIYVIAQEQISGGGRGSTNFQ
jgi:hemolysin activation/secretion protein